MMFRESWWIYIIYRQLSITNKEAVHLCLYSSFGFSSIKHTQMLSSHPIMRFQVSSTGGFFLIWLCLEATSRREIILHGHVLCYFRVPSLSVFSKVWWLLSVLSMRSYRKKLRSFRYANNLFGLELSGGKKKKKKNNRENYYNSVCFWMQ